MTLLRKYPVVVFVVVTVLLTYAAYLLPLPPLGAPMLIVFIPTLVAAALILLTGEQGGFKRLSRGLWRIGWRWALISIGLGAALRVGVSLLGVVLGWTPGFQLDPFSPLLVAVFLFAAAEEIGWRGYALPRLLEHFSPLGASLILGVPWAFLHGVLYLPGMMSEGLAFAPTFVVLLSLSVLLTWVYLGGNRSILAATLLHGTQNFLVFLNGGFEGSQVAWLMAIVYTAAALVVMLLVPALRSRKSVAHAVA